MKNKIIIILFSSFILMLFIGLFTNTRIINSPLIGKELPDFNLPLLGSTEIINAQILPKEPFLLNVWASWCLECIKEHHELMQINKDKNIQIIGINYKDEKQDARGWLEIYGNPYTYNLYDYDGEFAINLGVYGVPETFLVDKYRVIRAKYIGAITNEIYYNEIIPLVKKLNDQN